MFAIAEWTFWPFIGKLFATGHLRLELIDFPLGFGNISDFVNSDFYVFNLRLNRNLQ